MKGSQMIRHHLPRCAVAYHNRLVRCISNNAEYGDITRGPRIINEDSKNEMRRILKEIQTGVYAQEFLLENQTRNTKLTSTRRISGEHQIEEVGNKLRAMMPWIKANRLVDKSKN